MLEFGQALTAGQRLPGAVSRASSARSSLGQASSPVARLRPPTSHMSWMVRWKAAAELKYCIDRAIEQINSRVITADRAPLAPAKVR